MNFGWASAGKAALVAAALAALVLTGTEAWAKGGSGGRGGGGGRASHSGSKSGSHHHHHRGSRYSHGSSSGVFFYGSYFAFPAYWFAAAPSLPREPVYYIERSEEELRASSMWYYCESEAAYYPYVSQCPAGWVQVEPFALP